MATRIGAVVRSGVGVPVLVLSVLVAVFLIAMIVSLWYGLVESRHTSEYQEIANQQQLLSQRVATSAFEAAAGTDGAAQRLLGFKNRYENALNALSTGNLASGLPRVPEAVLPELELVEDSWQIGRQAVDTILAGEKPIRINTQLVSQIDDLVPQLIALTDETVSLCGTGW